MRSWCMWTGRSVKLIVLEDEFELFERHCETETEMADNAAYVHPLYTVTSFFFFFL